jgi:hypothetical protein
MEHKGSLPRLQELTKKPHVTFCNPPPQLEAVTFVPNVPSPQT